MYRDALNTQTPQYPSPRPAPNFWSAILVGLLTATGVALAGIFVGMFNQNPWKGMLVVGLCLLALALIAFIRQVGLYLQPLWVEDMAKWVDELIRRKGMRYQSYYTRFLTFQYRDFDIKGLSTQNIYTLELEQVFVDLCLDPKSLHEASTDPLAVKSSSHLLAGQHALWSYLEAETLQNQDLVILGPPGSGKTTLLKYVALTLANPKKRRVLSGRLQNAYRLPFLLFLREHTQAIQSNPDFSLVNAIESCLADWDRLVPDGWVQGQLRKGKCLILLDGLDEVADVESREKMVKWVQSQKRKYAQNRFLLTSRPFGYRENPVSGVMVLEVQPFTFEQIQQFVQKWYIANEIMSSQKDDAGVRMRAKTGARDLIRRVQQTPALISLAVNPLLLTMISTIHRYRSTLPGKRVELYAEICEVFLGKRQQARDQHIDLRPAQSISVLRPLAYEMMVQEQREISPQAAKTLIEAPLRLVDGQMTPATFLRMVENMSGLLLEQKSGGYSFAHLTFQEYLAATHIEKQGLEAILLGHIGESWWAETTRLYSAQADATQVIEVCLRQAASSVAHLELALECQEVSLQVQPLVKWQLDQIIRQGVEDAHLQLRKVVAETLLKRRIKEMVAIKDDVYRDTSLILCAEYQLFLDEQSQRGNTSRPEHWKEEKFPVGEALHPILGVRPSAAQAFCNWLTQREQSVWCYRLPRPGEYLPEMTIHSQPEWLALPPVNAFYGYWGEQTTFTWLRKPMDEMTDPLDLDAFDDEKSGVELGDNTNWQQHFSSILTIARDLALALASTSANASDFAFASALELASASTSASERTRNLALACDLALGSNLDLTRDLDLARGFDLARQLDLTRDLHLARDLAYDLAGHLAHGSRAVQLSSAFFPLARLFALLSICLSFSAYEIAQLQSELPTSPFWQRPLALVRKKKQDQSGRDIQKMLNRGIEIYYNLERLEKRKRGNEPAYEGILIVREHKQAEEK